MTMRKWVRKGAVGAAAGVGVAAWFAGTAWACAEVSDWITPPTGPGAQPPENFGDVVMLLAWVVLQVVTLVAVVTTVTDALTTPPGPDPKDAVIRANGLEVTRLSAQVRRLQVDIAAVRARADRAEGQRDALRAEQRVLRSWMNEYPSDKYTGTWWLAEWDRLIQRHREETR
jgi:hypothetical protein